MAKPLIDWYNETSQVFLNPLLPDSSKDRLTEAVAPYNDLKNHIWLASSGTENYPKMIALSKKAMLTSAEAVNLHLQATKEQSWLNVLPLFHTGGLGIHARAFLSGASVFDFSEKKWDPKRYVDQLAELNIAFSSLTPTQIYDIVSLNLSAPKNLKAIIVGGGVLQETLHEKAFSLGWPLLKSYGMTEVCSQIATSLNPNPQAPLEILKHIRLRFNPENFIEIKSLALLTGFVQGNDPEKKFIDPKKDGWYTTQDIGKMRAGFLQILGRGSHFMKIAGENVSVSELEAVWDNIKLMHSSKDDTVLIDLPNERLGRIICLAAAVSKERGEIEPLIEDYNRQVLPLAKIRKIYYLDSLPRTELQKLKKNELREIIKTHFT